MASPNDLRIRFDRLYTWAINCWISAAVVILLTYAAAALRLDDYPILPDGLRSMATAGYLDAPPDVSQVIRRLSDVSQQHVPAYFLTLFGWGNVAGWEPLALRALSIYFGVISLALIYRLARDFVSREIGFFAIVMLASLSFYNLWYLPIRMYTMIVATELALLWIYWRIVISQKHSFRHYLLLYLACLLFLNTQIFSLATGLGLALYHLIFVRKTRHWFYVVVVGVIAGLVFLPWLRTLLTGTAEIAGGEFGDIRVLDPAETVTTALGLGMNASIPFLGLLAISLKPALNRDKVSVGLWAILIVASAFYIVVNELTGAIDLHRARYFVFLFPLIILLLGKGLEQLIRWKTITLAILLFWIASGLLYQRRVGSDIFVRSYNTIPIHLIERHLRDDLRAGDLITGWSNGLSFAYRTTYGGVADYYFAEHRVEIGIKHVYALGQLGEHEIVAQLEAEFANRERVWLAYELDNTARYAELFQRALDTSHMRCLRDRSVANVALELYHLHSCN